MLKFIAFFIAGLLSEHGSVNKAVLRIVIDIVALAAQISGFVVWPLIEGGRQPALWFIPLALLLTSFGWWENFVSKKSALGI
jgi:chitin synthase